MFFPSGHVPACRSTPAGPCLDPRAPPLGQVNACRSAPAGAQPQGLGTSCLSFPYAAQGAPAPPSPPSTQTAPCTLGAAASPSRPLAQGHPHVPCVPAPGGATRGLGPGRGRGLWQARGPLVGVQGHLPAARGGRRHQPDVRLDVSGLQSAAPGAWTTEARVCALVTRSAFPGKVTRVAQALK